MEELRFDGRSEVAEVRRRLRLSRLVPGVGRTSALVWAGPDGQVKITVSPPNSELAAQIAALFPDIQVVIGHGVWRRS